MTKAIKLVDTFEQDSTHVSALAEVDEAGAGMRVKARKVLKSLQKVRPPFVKGLNCGPTELALEEDRK